ncbi:MAG TPA: hypothetical protein VHU83_19645 [Bryobacteraceae bacterium]|jgi:hypothetical protein|nr:hypothetical protein [Bryobacteraceae bacterium]
MEDSEQIATSHLDLQRKKLGEISINKDAFDLDLKINEGYQNYSGELLRLALLILTGIAAVWVKLYLPVDNHPKALHLFNRVTFVCSFAATVIAAGAALVHRYTAADSLAYHLTSLRRRARNRPDAGPGASDVELADRQDRERDKRFKWSGTLLRLSVGFLFLGLLLFCSSLAALMF